mgnify:FL=1
MRNTEHPELRQPTAQEVIENILYQADEKEGVIFVTGGPLSNIAKFVSSNSSHRSLIKVNIITACTCITNKYYISLPIQISRIGMHCPRQMHVHGNDAFCNISRFPIQSLNLLLR